MKKLEERRAIIQQLIDNLEILRPRIEAAGGSPSYFAYSRPMAALKIVGNACVTVAILAVLSIIVFADGKLDGTPGLVFVLIVLPCFGIAVVTHWATDLRKYTYLLASQKAMRDLEQTVTSYRKMVEEFEQRQQEAEIYRPKFDQLYSIITHELKGIYKPHWQIERHFKIKIGFGKYKAEYYNLNQNDYAKLLFRIIDARSEHGDDAQLKTLIQNCENSLQL